MFGHGPQSCTHCHLWPIHCNLKVLSSWVQEQKEWGGRSGVSSPTHEGMLALHKAIQTHSTCMVLPLHTTHSTCMVLPPTHHTQHMHGPAPTHHTQHMHGPALHTTQRMHGPALHTTRMVLPLHTTHSTHSACMIHTTDGQPCV